MKRMFILALTLLALLCSCEKTVPDSPPPFFPCYSEHNIGYLMEYNEECLKEDYYVFDIVFRDYNLLKSITGYDIYFKNNNETKIVKEISFEEYVDTSSRYIENVFIANIEIEKEFLLYDYDNIGTIEIGITRNDNPECVENFMYKIVDNDIVCFIYCPNDLEERIDAREWILTRNEEDYAFVHYENSYMLKDLYLLCKDVYNSYDGVIITTYIKAEISSWLKDFNASEFISENDIYIKTDKSDEYVLMEYEIINEQYGELKITVPNSMLPKNERVRFSFFRLKDGFEEEFGYIYIIRNGLEIYYSYD